MAGTVLKLKKASFAKYLIQLSIFYQEYDLTVLLVHSDNIFTDIESPLIEKHHEFMIKSLLIAGKFDLAYLYLLKNYTRELYINFLSWSKINGNLEDLIHLKV